MSVKQKVLNRVEGTLLRAIMLAIALVLEKALERVAEGGRGKPRSQWGRRLVGRVMPSAHLQHHHDRHPAP